MPPTLLFSSDQGCHKLQSSYQPRSRSLILDLKAFFSDSFKKSALNLQKLAESAEVQEQVTKAAAMIVESYKSGGGLFTAGNGGSAADAQHIAAEMVGKLSKDRTPLKSYAMTVDSSYLTAVGNDYGFDHIFSRQVEGLMTPKDVFLGITTSGNSINLVYAYKMCKKNGIPSILLTGKGGGKIHSEGLSDLMINAPGLQTAEIQEAHIAIYHALCFAVEFSLIEAKYIQYR